MMDRNTNIKALTTFYAVYAAVAAFLIFMIIGWFMNVFDLLHMVGGEVTTLFILRVVGLVVAPLGSILGWFF